MSGIKGSGMKVIASAPNKIHIAGEHSIVFGGLALIAPVEMNRKRNVVELGEAKSWGAPKLVFKGSPLGEAELRADGSRVGDSIWFPALDVARFVFTREGFALGEARQSIFVERFYSGAPKGTGNSASISAALALALYALLGKKPSRDELFEAAFVGDNAWHGGRASGGDVAAVIADCTQRVKKKFLGGEKFVLERSDARLELPRETTLLLASSRGAAEPTSETTARFAAAHNARAGAAALSELERLKIYEEYDAIVDQIISECKASGDGERLGALLDKNHSLLARDGVSAPEIEEVRDIAASAGALGSKLSGGGGRGGAVIVLVASEKLAKVKKALREAGLACFDVVLASKGASIDLMA